MVSCNELEMISFPTSRIRSAYSYKDILQHQHTEPGAEKWTHKHFDQCFNVLDRESAILIKHIQQHWGVAVAALWKNDRLVVTVQCLRMDEAYPTISINEFYQQVASLQGLPPPSFWTGCIQTQHLVFRVVDGPGVAYKIAENKTISLVLDHIWRDAEPRLFTFDMCESMRENAYSKVHIDAMKCHFVWNQIKRHVGIKDPKITELIRMVVTHPDPITNYNHCATRILLEELEQTYKDHEYPPDFDFQEAMRWCKNR